MYLLKNKIFIITGIYRVFANSGPSVIPNHLKPKNLESGIFFPPVSNIKVFKMQKFNFPVFSRKPVFGGFTENNDETPLSEGAFHNLRKFRIFWDLFDHKWMKNDQMHSGTVGRTFK